MLCNNSDNPEGNTQNYQTKMPNIWIFWTLDSGQSKSSGAKGAFCWFVGKKKFPWVTLLLFKRAFQVMSDEVTTQISNQ